MMTTSTDRRRPVDALEWSESRPWCRSVGITSLCRRGARGPYKRHSVLEKGFHASYRPGFDAHAHIGHD